MFHRPIFQKFGKSKTKKIQKNENKKITQKEENIAFKRNILLILLFKNIQNRFEKNFCKKKYINPFWIILPFLDHLVDIPKNKKTKLRKKLIKKTLFEENFSNQFQNSKIITK